MKRPIAQRGLYANQPPTPDKGTNQPSNVTHNPLRGSYEEPKGGLRDRTPGERLSQKPTSRKLAMEAMCWDCQGGEHADPGWKWAIGNCNCTTCPLHGFRPYQKKAGTPGEGVYKDYYGDGGVA